MGVKTKRSIAILMCLILTIMPTSQSGAKSKKPALSKKKVTVQVKKTKKLKIKNTKGIKKTKWSVKSKKVVKLTKKKKTSVTIKGLKAGKKTKVTAKVTVKGKKKPYKLTCTVTVKKKSTSTPKPPITPGKTNNNPSAAPSKAPANEPSKAPTNEPSTAPTNEPSTAPTDEPSTAPTDVPSTAPTNTPIPTATPGSEDDLRVNISSDNVLFGDTLKEEYHDGEVDLELASADSGHGICYYLNNDHVPVDLSQYKELIIDFVTETNYDLAISFRNEPTKKGDYWSGANSTPIGGDSGVSYPTIKNGQYKLNIKNLTSSAAGLFIKYNTYNKEGYPETANFTIRSITLIKDPDAAPPKPAEEDYTLNLSKDNIAYAHTDDMTYSVDDNGLTVDAAVRLKNVGIWLKDDKSEFDYRQYEAIKIEFADISAPANNDRIQVSLSMYTDITSEDAATYGGGTKIASVPSLSLKKADLEENGNTIVDRTDLWTPEEAYPTGAPATLLNIRLTAVEKFTIKSITFLKKYPYADDDVTVNISEKNIAFSNVENCSIVDGKLKLDLKYGEKIGLYLKDDHSTVENLKSYAYLDMYTLNETPVLVNPNVMLLKDVSTDDAESLGGGTALLEQPPIVGFNRKVHYWSSDTRMLTGLADDNQAASVIYFYNNNKNKTTINLTIGGIRLRKHKYW